MIWACLAFVFFGAVLLAAGVLNEKRDNVALFARWLNLRNNGRRK